MKWPQIFYRFKTASDNSSDKRSFVFGSCRYFFIEKFSRFPFLVNKGDKNFKSILEKMDEWPTPINALLFIGDQIYADDLRNPFPDKKLWEYFNRYQRAFSSRYIRKLISRVPTYMTLDDHEIENDWPTHKKEGDEEKYKDAILAYKIYQLSHSPLFNTFNEEKLIAAQNFWYEFFDGCCDFFVTDTRTQRDLRLKKIISEEQMNALKVWLKNDTKKVKFLVSAVPIFPDNKKWEIKDKWSGFIKQRDELINFIFENQIRKVVFLSGDVHASLAAELVSPRFPTTKIISIISSPFYSVLPRPTSNYFHTEGKLETQSKNEYKIQNASEIYSKDNFTRVETDGKMLRIEVYSKEGKKVREKEYFLEI
jgi:alkaline phosphatase D